MNRRACFKYVLGSDEPYGVDYIQANLEPIDRIPEDAESLNEAHLIDYPEWLHFHKTHYIYSLDETMYLEVRP